MDLIRPATSAPTRLSPSGGVAPAAPPAAFPAVIPVQDPRPGGEAGAGAPMPAAKGPGVAGPPPALPSPPALEAALDRSLADVARARSRTLARLDELPPYARAQVRMLAGVAEIRDAIVPPPLTALDRRR